MRTVKFEKAGAFGRDRGGLPVWIDEPNRAMRRLVERQQKKGRPDGAQSQTTQTKQQVTKGI